MIRTGRKNSQKGREPSVGGCGLYLVRLLRKAEGWVMSQCVLLHGAQYFVVVTKSK